MSIFKKADDCEYCQHLSPFANEWAQDIQVDPIIRGREINLGVLGYEQLCLDMYHDFDGKYYLNIWEKLFDCDTNDSVEIHYCPFCGRKLDE